MLAENEQMLLEQAMEAFHRETGLRLKAGNTAHKAKQPEADAVVTLNGDKGVTYAAEVKKWAQQANLGALIEQIKRLPMKGLLVADYVNPNMAARLRGQGIPFIDTAGNAYIGDVPFYIYIKGNQPRHQTPERNTATGRAFTYTGLKVLYAFLCEPELVRAPYRRIAGIADVALGTIGGVMDDLKAGGYLVERGGKTQRRLVRYRDLLDRWTEIFPEKLQRKQFMGRYAAAKADWWKYTELEAFNGYWGGEIAGAYYTRYLRPEEATVYINPKNAKKLLQQAKLHKWTDKAVHEYPVHIYKPFWAETALNTGYVHPVLAYAELIAKGDARNIETARMIFDEYIAGYIEQD